MASFNFEFTCELCAEDFKSNLGGVKGGHTICPKCKRALNWHRRSELLHNDYQLRLYRERIRKTGKRTYLTAAEREIAHNHGPADGCPEDCFYSRYCGGARDCEYTLYAKKLRPKGCRAFSDKCKLYKPATEEEKIKSRNAAFRDGEFDGWNYEQVLRRIKLY